LSFRSNMGVRDPEVRFSRATRWGEPPTCNPGLGPCLIYLGADNGNGYGQFRYNGRNNYAHRYAWERVHGPIPDGLTVDHLCRVRRCVNVEHLDLTDRLDNYMRGVRARDKCRNGHRYTADNLIDDPNHPGQRICKECHEDTVRRGALRRTNAFRGIEDARVRYDPDKRDRLVVDVVERRMTVREAAEALGCAPKYMDKMVSREAKARGVTNRRKHKAPILFNGWTEFTTRLAVRERSNGACERCDAARATDMHHRKNRSQSGKWHPANIVHLCALCHVEITANPKASRESGFSIRQHEDPADIPLIYRRGPRVRLCDKGSIEYLKG
jgi:transposase-like protein